MPSEDSRTLFISDEAYEHLQHMAAAQNKRLHKFIAEYFAAAPTLYDTRPDDVIAEDEARIAAGMAAEWTLYSPRRRRLVKINQDTLGHIVTYAHALGISGMDIRLVGRPHTFNLIPVASLLLEAIGTGWVSNERP